MRLAWDQASWAGRRPVSWQNPLTTVYFTYHIDSHGKFNIWTRKNTWGEHPMLGGAMHEAGKRDESAFANPRRN
jgi:hypothetical protein